MSRIFLLIAAIVLTLNVFAQSVTERPLIYQTPEMKKVQVRQKVEYRKVNDTSLTMDIYYPPGFDKKKNLPVVVFNNGAGGLEIPTWRGYIDWAKLVAANGMIAVNHQTRPNRATVMDDCGAVLEFLHTNGKQYNIDGDRIGVWTSSANSRTGMTLALRPGRPYIRALVVYYGAPDSIGQLRQDVPTQIVRAGLDAQFLNIAMDNFVFGALMQDIRVELINYLDGIHAFDIYTKTPEARAVIKKTIDFLKENLTTPVPASNERLLTNRNFMWMMMNGRSQDAVAAFRKAVVQYRADSSFHPFYNAVIREDVLNTNAYFLLRNNRQAEALEAFKLMVEAYPASANAHDGLADAYEALGNKAEALRHSEKSLELLPADRSVSEQMRANIRRSVEEKIRRLKQNG